MYGDSLIIVQQNIRSVRKNFDEFILKLENLETLPHVIILTEIWIESHEINMFTIPGFSMYAKCNNSYRAGGIIIYVGDTWECHIMKSPEMQTADKVHLQINLNDKINIDVLGLYRLQAFHENTFVDELCTVLSTIKNQNVILSGDINIDLLNRSNVVDNYLINMANLGLESVLEVPTRITAYSNTLIDHIFVRRNVNIKMSCKGLVIDSQITDHCMTAVSVKCERHKNSIKSNENNEKVKIDFDLLRNNLNSTEWNAVFSENTVSQAYATFLNILNQCIAKSSKVSGRTKHHLRKLKPWMNPTLLKKVDEKNFAYKKCKQQPNNDQLQNTYKTLKLQLSVDIKTTKNNYYTLKFEESSRDPKKQWAIVKEITGENDRKGGEIVLQGKDKVRITCQKTVANTFNKFFSTVADGLREKIAKDQNKIIDTNQAYEQSFQEKSNVKSIFLYPVSRDEIRALINSLATRKSPGFDNIVPQLIKIICDNIVDIIVYLINFSFSEGEFPEDLKKGVVIPLHKKAEKENTDNYRPITLLSVFSKIFEKAMKTRLIKFLNNNTYFSTNQFGFRKSLNTENALLNFVEKIYDGLNRGEYCAGLFIDIMKAFDTVDHVLLLNRLYNAGIRGVAYNWFRTYLTGRIQQTRVSGELSEDEFVKNGIPQGSVLSGPLFLIYVNDLCNGRFRGQLSAFADDTAFVYTSSTIEQLNLNIEHDLFLLRIWFTKNFMFLSPKTKYMTFYLRRHFTLASPLKYHEIDCTLNTCNCLEIGVVDQMKYLGIIIDSKLSWKPHITHVKNKLIYYIRRFYLLNKLCSPSFLRTLYYAFINSKLEYGLTVWGGAYYTTTKPLTTLQKFFIRIICNKSRNEHTGPLFKTLRILPLRNLYIYKVLKTFYNRSSVERAGIRQQRGELRNRANVYIPRPNLAHFRKFYTFLGPKFYNCLPKQIQEIKNKNKFLREIKNYLIVVENIDTFYNIIV